MHIHRLIATASVLALMGAAGVAAAQPPAEPAPAEVCLTNACSTPATPIPVAAPAVGRVDYVGTAPIPAGQAFARYFDGNSPVLLRGRVTDVRMIDGMSAEIFVRSAEDSKLWRVMGGNPASLSAEARAEAAGMVGRDVVVRGYQAHDKTCDGGCILNGRDVTYPDGAKVFAPKPAP